MILVTYKIVVHPPHALTDEAAPAPSRRSGQSATPLVTIHLREYRAVPEHRRAIAESVHLAMMDVLKIPSDDRFQLIVEHSPENMIQDRVFFGIERSDDSVSVQIVVNHRDPSQKLKMYELIVDNLAESPGIRKEDVFIGVVEVARENWWVTSRFPGRHPGYQQAGMSARRNPRRAADTGCCRGVPGHPSNHRANIAVHRSRPPWHPVAAPGEMAWAGGRLRSGGRCSRWA